MIVLFPGLEMKLKSQQYPVVIAATGVSVLFSVECTVAGLRLGTSTTLTALKDVLQELISSEPGKERLTISVWAETSG